MKITPLEIRQKEFEKNFRGYDKDEVNAFLQTLSQEWERILEENRDMRFKLESTQREVEKLREVESSLFKTLKTAEDTGASMIDQANKTAELRIRESNIKAEEILSEARLRGKAIVEKAENKAQQIVEEMHLRFKSLRQNYKDTESDYESLVFKLKSLANDILKKVERMEERQQYDIDKKTDEAEQVLEEYRKSDISSQEPVAKEEESASEEVEQNQGKENEMEHEIMESPKPEDQKPNKRRSFFDDIN